MVESMYREAKYFLSGPIVNRATGAAIPDDEPIFIIRAQDVFAVPILRLYGLLSNEPMTVISSISRFRDWQEANPGRVKVPD